MSSDLKTLIQIVNGVPIIQVDTWQLVRDAEEAQAMLTESTEVNAIFPLSVWMQLPASCKGQVRALWISPDDDFEASMEWLAQMEMIAVDFPSFRDGRGYSVAYLLRTRYGWKGELRAIGDVLRDQLNYMRRCGFDVFVLRADKDIQAALKSFNHYSVQYQGGVDEPLPLFRRRVP